MAKSFIFTPLGATNHSLGERQNEDFYATEPKAAELLLDVVPELNNIWECACGQGHLAKVFDSVGKLYKATDLIDRGYGATENFLLSTESYQNGDIVTNPPYKVAQQFVEHAIALVDVGIGRVMHNHFIRDFMEMITDRSYPTKTLKDFMKIIDDEHSLYCERNFRKGSMSIPDVFDKKVIKRYFN